MSDDDAQRIEWTHRLIGTEPKPKGSGPRERGKYVGALDQAWVKDRFGKPGKPLTGTALYHWRRKGIPLEHVSKMVEELQGLLPPGTTREAAVPDWARRLERGVQAIGLKVGVDPALFEEIEALDRDVDAVVRDELHNGEGHQQANSHARDE